MNELEQAKALLQRVLEWEACDQREVDLQDEITAFLKPSSQQRDCQP